MTLSLALLGTFDVRLQDRAISDFRAQSVRALLAYLAIEADRPHEREHLCAMLWPDEPLQTALTSLRQALHRLRQAIEPEGEEGRYLVITRQSVQLNRAALRLDIDTFKHAIQAAAAHKHRSDTICDVCARRLREALALYRGDLLPGFSLSSNELFEEWLLVERERLRNQLSSLLDTLSAYHERRGEFAEAVELLRHWVAVEPWHEPAHLRLIGTMAHAGQRTLALRQFERYRAFLAAELGIEPGPAVRQLITQVRAGLLTPPAKPRLRHAPVGATPFIGRDHELAQLTAQLSDPACRVLTLTGMGGTGKTRLAIEAAQAACHTFAEGAVFVSLASIEHAEQMPEALSAVLGLSIAPNRPPLDQLIEELRGRELLLLLDNCEQVADLGPLLAQILAAAPRLTLLATSRVPLDLRCERVVPIHGLDLPAHSEPPPDPREYAAGRLFLQIAGQVQPAFCFGPDEASLVLECCTLLDGGPLAIELAATQLRTHSLVQIVAALRADLNSLATTMGDVPPRHRSLRAVFDWSWRLLSPGAQRALAGLAVFVGDFDSTAAREVVGETAPLERLAAGSLLRREGEDRYSMHEQIRQFAAERLEALSDADLVRDHHCAHYLRLAAKHALQIDGPQAAGIIATLHPDQGNLRQAWERAAGQADYELLGRAIPVFGQIYARSDLHEGAAQFSKLLEQIRPEVPTAPQISRQILEILIGQLQTIGRLDEAVKRTEELLALSRNADDRPGEAAARLAQSDLALHRRDFPAAWAYLDDADRLSANEPSRKGRIVYARALLRRAGLIDWQQLPVNLHYAERAYAIYTELDMPHYASVALNRLGNQHRRRGDYGCSLEVRRQALALIDGQGDLDQSTHVLNDLGELYLLLGCYRQARHVFERGLAMTRRLHMPKMEVVILEGLGRTLFHLGDLPLAGRQIEHALALNEVCHALVHRGYFLTTLGYVAEQGRDWDAAARHYAEAAHWWEESHHRSDAIVEPRAGLARLELARQNPRGAIAHVEAVLPYLENGLLQDALEPMWVHQSCYQVLAAAGDWRAEGVLIRARELLEAQAAQISDPDLRDSFLYNVVAHRALLSIAPARERSIAA